LAGCGGTATIARAQAKLFGQLRSARRMMVASFDLLSGFCLFPLSVSAHGFGDGCAGTAELFLVRKSGGHREFDPAHANADQGADLEQFQTDRAATCFGKLRVSEPDAAQRFCSVCSLEGSV
jgi:hypothetical protein